MQTSDEEAIRRRAYELWEKEGSPDGRDLEFWERARLMLETEGRWVETPLQDQSLADHATDTAVADTFPASDPPSFTSTEGVTKPR